MTPRYKILSGIMLVILFASLALVYLKIDRDLDHLNATLQSCHAQLCKISHKRIWNEAVADYNHCVNKNLEDPEICGPQATDYYEKRMADVGCLPDEGVD